MAGGVTPFGGGITLTLFCASWFSDNRTVWFWRFGLRFFWRSNR